MGPRVTETERLKHKVLIRLNDDLYSLLLEESRRRLLAPSIVARQVFAEGLSEIRRKGEETGRENKEAIRGAADETTG